MLRILYKTLKTGTVTANYPASPELAPEGFRGKPEISADKCTFCGACASVCPPGVIRIKEEPGATSLSLYICGCIFCGRCEEVCQPGAIALSRDYELASKTKDDLIAVIRRKK
ncbi:MAG TPA: 4Fe-4S dicluster domain-containing protein [Candidatus Methanoperedenaceae archaeon]|nr:4Fe-4S dicluster domain-containing protein [Candidatus Methanoperedenaceae archaeon]